MLSNRIKKHNYDKNKQKIKLLLTPFILFRSILLITFIFILATACNTTEPTPKVINGTAELTVEDASSTEVWLNLHAGVGLPADVKIYKDNKLSRTINLISKDTVIYEDNLLPQKSYTFRATAKLGDIELQSQNVTAVTMDTTSHSFIAETFTFGEHSSSRLFDVSIIDENNIWAVGEIFMNDSLGQPDPHAYNAVHWNGSEWELKKIQSEFRGNNITVPLEGIIAFGSTDIWFVGSLPIHGDGNNWTMYDLRTTVDPSLSLSKAWGSNSNNIYLVGRSGSIAHYNGSEWEKIESGTELEFHDIYGNNGKIYCVAAQLFSGINSELYEIKNNNALLIDNTNLGLSSVSIYVLREKLYVFGYYRLVRTEGKIGWEQISEPVNFDGYAKIRGNGYNDVVAVGSFGKIYHYNGISWKLRRIGENINNLIDFSSVAIKNNIICAVGKTKNFATIVIGRR